MQTKVSTKGQIVLARAIRRHRVFALPIPLTGLPVLSAGAYAPVLSSREVEEILANFP